MTKVPDVDDAGLDEGGYPPLPPTPSLQYLPFPMGEMTRRDEAQIFENQMMERELEKYNSYKPNAHGMLLGMNPLGPLGVNPDGYYETLMNMIRIQNAHWTPRVLGAGYEIAQGAAGTAPGKTAIAALTSMVGKGMIGKGQEYWDHYQNPPNDAVSQTGGQVALRPAQGEVADEEATSFMSGGGTRTEGYRPLPKEFDWNTAKKYRVNGKTVRPKGAPKDSGMILYIDARGAKAWGSAHPLVLRQ
ncbi:MAG: hypothetical protein V3R93_07830 [Candidatus Hydrothermarchaeaceae archaeon]